MILVNPLNGVITSGYSPNRLHPKLLEVWPHWGTDIGGRPRGIRHWIVSAADGVVIAAYGGWKKDSPTARKQNQYLSRLTGNHVVVEHADVNGQTFRTYYGHLDRVNVKVGQRVRAGDRLGTQGATGNVTGAHLHLEVWLNGMTVDPVPFFKKHGEPLGSGSTKRIEAIVAKLDKDDYEAIAQHVWSFYPGSGKARSAWTRLTFMEDKVKKNNDSQGLVERIVRNIGRKLGVY